MDEIERNISILRNSSDFWEKENATERLVDIGEPAVLPMIRTFGTDDSTLLFSLVTALAKIGEPAVLPLIASLDDPRAIVRRFAAIALIDIGETANPALRDAIRGKNPTSQNEAALILEKKGLENLSVSDRVLCHLILDQIHLIPPIGSPAVFPLIELLGDEFPLRQDVVIQTIELVGEPAVLPLIQLVEGKNKRLRQIAIGILGNIGDQRAIPCLIEALKDDDWLIRSIASESIPAILNKCYLPESAAEWMKSAEEVVKNISHKPATDIEQIRLRSRICRLISLAMGKKNKHCPDGGLILSDKKLHRKPGKKLYCKMKKRK